MGKEFTDVTDEELCDLMCGKPEDDGYDIECDTVVSHPRHYADTCSIECIEAMTLAFGVEAVYNFCVCNAFKYLWRHQNKNGEEDLHKAQWYINKAEELYDRYSNDATIAFDIYSKEDVTLLNDMVEKYLYGE